MTTSRPSARDRSTCDPARLSEVLGATPKTNQYGEYLSVRCWCAQPPRYSPDLRALKLLVPDAPDEIADPLTNGSFSTRKRPVLPAAAARMHFSLALHGGKAAA